MITVADIDRVYQGLQHLQGLPATKNNLAIVLDALTVLEGCAAAVAEMKAPETEAPETEAPEAAEEGETDE